MFERQLRIALRKSPHNIELFTSSFQIDENASSQTASFRFRNVPKPDEKQNRGRV